MAWNRVREWLSASEVGRLATRRDESPCRTRKLNLVQELPEGTVAILFTDVVGSTELTDRLGDEPAREVLGASDQLVREQIEWHRGQAIERKGEKRPIRA